jgi:hypothetical protein
MLRFLVGADKALINTVAEFNHHIAIDYLTLMANSNGAKLLEQDLNSQWALSV